MEWFRWSVSKRHLSSCDILPQCLFFLWVSCEESQRKSTKWSAGSPKLFKRASQTKRGIENPAYQHCVDKTISGGDSMNRQVVGIRMWCWQATSQPTIASSPPMMPCMALIGEESKCIWHGNLERGGRLDYVLLKNGLKQFLTLEVIVMSCSAALPLFQNRQGECKRPWTFLRYCCRLCVWGGGGVVLHV